MDKVIRLFATPLHQTNLSVSQSVFEFIKSQEFSYHGNGYMTREDILEYPEMENVKRFITNKVKLYLYDICGISDTMIPELVTSWVNLHKKNDWAQIHSHKNSVVSGVWYLSTTDESGNFIVYNNPNNTLFGNLLEFPKKENEFNSSKKSYTPQNGDLILFPSNLQHSVNSNKSYKERFSLAFNYMLRGNLISGANSTVKL